MRQVAREPENAGMADADRTGSLMPDRPRFMQIDYISRFYIVK